MGASLALFAFLVAQTQQTRLTISVGDTLEVHILGFADPAKYVVLSDGSISGSPYGRVVVSGLTVDQAAAKIAEQSKWLLKDPKVFVGIIIPVDKYVHVVGGRSAVGRVPWRDGMDLRSVVAGAEVDLPADNYDVRVFRRSQEVARVNLQSLLTGDNTQNPPLQVDDVVSVARVDTIKVYAVDRFATPGEIEMKVGATLAEAVAKAGGPVLAPPTGVETTEPGYAARARIRVVRGGQVTDFDPDAKDQMAGFRLESGDTLTVVTPKILTVSVAGEVVEPGRRQLLEGADVMEAIAASKGQSDQATLRRVMVVRGDDVFSIDLTKRLDGTETKPFLLTDRDLVVVPENTDFVYVLGTVNEPGRYSIEDAEKSMRASEALAKAGGVSTEGTLRRVVLARPGPDGKYAVQQFNLDEFLKDGKIEANPLLQAGDFLYFGQPKGVTAETFLRVLPSVLLLEQR